MPEKEIEVLLSGYLDGELTQQERQKVGVYLERDERYREILEELKRAKTETESLHYEKPQFRGLEVDGEEPGRERQSRPGMGHPGGLGSRSDVLRTVGTGHGPR